MNVQIFFEEFLERSNVQRRKKYNDKILKESFYDIDRVLDLGRMSEKERKEFLNFMDGIGMQVSIDKKTTIQFFDRINKVLMAIEKWKSHPISIAWQGTDLDKASIDFKNKLEDIYKAKNEWQGRGRNLEKAPYQAKSIREIYKILKKSKKGSPKRWSCVEIKEHGTFERRKSYAGQTLFAPTPARLISNFAKGLGVNLPEMAVQYEMRSK